MSLPMLQIFAQVEQRRQSVTGFEVIGGFSSMRISDRCRKKCGKHLCTQAPSRPRAAILLKYNPGVERARPRICIWGLSWRKPVGQRTLRLEKKFSGPMLAEQAGSKGFRTPELEKPLDQQMLACEILWRQYTLHSQQNYVVSYF